jgi:hypothetical protein
MVEEEWKIGDEFIVTLTLEWGYLKEVGTTGKFYGHTPLNNSDGVPSIFFTPQKDASIHLSRIQKINRIYELW